MSVSYSFTVITFQADDMKYSVVHTTADGSHNVTSACVLISQSVTQYVIFSVVINRFIQTSIKVINLQAVCFTQGLPLSQFHILFLGNNCRLTFHFAGKRDTKLKVHKLIAWSYNYFIMSQLWWRYKCVRDSNKQNLLQ